MLCFAPRASLASSGMPIPLQPPRDKCLGEVRVRATARNSGTGPSNGDLLLRALLAGPSGYQASAQVIRDHRLMSYRHNSRKKREMLR